MSWRPLERPVNTSGQFLGGTRVLTEQAPGGGGQDPAPHAYRSVNEFALGKGFEWATLARGRAEE